MPPETATGAPPPFLRAPPFPWIRNPAPIGGAVGEPDEAGYDAGLRALRCERVGGAFWGPRLAPRPVVARAVDGKLPAALAGRAGEVALVPAHASPDPWTLAEAAGQVWGAEDDELVLVARLCGRPTLDADGAPHDPARLDAAFARALAGRKWRDPFTGGPASLADVAELLGRWRRELDANRRVAACVGMAGWKREAIARFLWDGERSPPFLRPDAALRLPAGSTVACWPSRTPPGFEARAQARGLAVAWVEDGFVRSEGLGADCRPPASIALDFGGVHYDPETPSDLEAILRDHPFPPDLVDRARRLRERIVAERIGKYGVSRGAAPSLPAGRRIVVAIGQVGDDLSVARGGAGLGGDAPFLQRVREAEPDAFILYRPHPDVLAGHRRGHVALDEARRWADRVEGGGDLLALVERADAVHVLSSLTGFEALLRGREVVVHGRPFYAGWGLTRDLAPQGGRRGRILSLDRLVAGALILFPRYLDPVTRLPCPPETLVDRLAAGEATAGGWLPGVRRAQGRLRRRLTLLAEALR